VLAEDLQAYFDRMLKGETWGAQLDYGLVGDTKTTLRALTPKLLANDDEEHLAVSRERYKEARRDLDALAVNSGKLIHPQYVTRVLDRLAADDAIFTCDVGTPTIWAARYLTMNGKRRILGSFNHGSMANAMPQSSVRSPLRCQSSRSTHPAAFFQVPNWESVRRLPTPGHGLGGNRRAR
jgi:hypothetical protein